MTASPGEDVPRKSTLFCPCCDHQSPVDGDWARVDAASATRYVCPQCDVAITVRPDFEETGVDDDVSPMMAWVRCWRTWGRTLSRLQGATRRLVTGT